MPDCNTLNLDVRPNSSWTDQVRSELYLLTRPRAYSAMPEPRPVSGESIQKNKPTAFFPQLQLRSSHPEVHE